MSPASPAHPGHGFPRWEEDVRAPNPVRAACLMTSAFPGGRLVACAEPSKVAEHLRPVRPPDGRAPYVGRDAR